MSKPHKYAELIHAWADGEKIQIRDIVGDVWNDDSYPTWHDSFTYRIKPIKITVYDWLVKFENYAIYYPGYTEENIKKLYPDGEIFQRIDGTEKEIEI